MKSDIYFIPSKENEDDGQLCLRLEKLLREKELFAFARAGDFVAIKTHFGEEGTKGYIRPLFLKAAGGLLRERGCLPFLTETSTLYSGRRHNAVEHMRLAEEHGFGFAATGLPLIMADGLLGNEELEVESGGQIYRKVKLAALVVRAHALVLFSHFTGHVATGFGAALKNLGMGCSSRKGKLSQHSTAKPSVRTKKCTGCEACIEWCPAAAIAMAGSVARIDAKKCIGCGECLTVCRFAAIGYNWSETYVQLQRKIVEHAWGLAKNKAGKMLCLNFLTRISKDCDCMAHAYQEIAPDIGILVGDDPVALDAASIDLVEKRGGKPLSQLAFDIPCREQIDHARRLGFGAAEYRLLDSGY